MFPKSNRLFCLLAQAISCLTLFHSIPALARGPKTPPSADVVVHSEKPGLTIAPDFLGLSYEAPALTKDTFSITHKEFLRLLANLGTGTLRFGGNSVESTFWSREGVVSEAASRGTITPKDLDRLFEFSRQSRWRVILGLNLGHYDPSMSADEAAYAVEKAGPSLLALEIGNEPDLFMKNGLRNSNWSYDNFRREFETYAQKITARTPAAPLSGPTTCCTLGPEWFEHFVADEESRLVFASHHIYPMSAAQSNPDAPSFPSIGRMLSPELMNRVADLVDRLASAAEARHLQLRIAETNSASHGGKEGVSNTFASALWGADYAFTLAEHGATALNFHGGFACHGYTPICIADGHFVPQPLYYGMLLFHLALPGKAGRLVPVDVRAPGNLTAHAVLSDGGSLRIVLINKDAQKAMTVEISEAQRYSRVGLPPHPLQTSPMPVLVPYRSGSVRRLMAPALDSTTGITLAGTAVNAQGGWSGMPGDKLKKHKNAFRLELPPGTAALVHLYN